MDVTEEESSRLIGLLDDGTKASIGTMFMGREMNGFVSMDQLSEMMTELQVAFDLDNLAKVVNEDTWDRIDLEQSMLIIAYCVDSAQKQVAQQAKADSAVVVAQAAQPVVYLNTFEYLLHLTPCSTKEEGVEYRWARVKLDVRPKTILMVSVAVMMVIAAIALISATIGLNERATREQAKDALDHLSVTVDVSSAVLMDEAVRSVVADALRSTSEVTSAISNGLLNAHQEIVMEQLRVGLTQTKAAIVAETEDAAKSSTNALLSTIQTISLMFSAEPRSALLGFATNYLTRGKMIFVSDSTGALVLPSVCSGQAPTFSMMTSTETTGTERGCGEDLYFACQGVYHSGTRICVAETKSSRHVAQRALIDEIVTETNLLRPHASIELQAALLPETTGEPYQSIGGRKKLPMLCLRSHECLHSGQEIYQWAHNSSTGGTREVTGYDTSKWLSAYDKIVVQDQEVLLGLKEDVSESKLRFVTALGAGSNRNRNATLSPILIFAVADSLERVEVLPINQTSVTVAQETYLGYALNGRQGISFPNIADASSIMSGYSSALGGDLAVGLEYTATDISSSSSEFVLQTLAALNSKIPQNWEIVVAEETIKGSGMTSYVIPLKRPCPADTGCRQHSAVQDALQMKTSGSVDEGTDYAGDGFAGWYLYYDRASPLVVVVQYSASELDDIIIRRRWIALAVGVSIIVAVQLIILLLTRRVLDRIENDYNKYKRQIEDEKHQFSELVKDVMPPYIAERIMKGTRLIAETHPQLTFFFSDIVGSTETSKTMTNKYLVRMLGYSFMLEDEIANYFGVHKIKTIGDAYFAVSGLEDNIAGGATQGKEHQVYRMASFACICQQLFGPTYTHYPERTECFRISAANQKMEPMKMVRMRMGIHTGPAVAGVVDVGRAPHFDCFGPSVNLASRMESTSAPGRVQISGPTYELLSKLDKEGLFEYEAPRKTLVKGFGTMVTYMVRSTTLPVPEQLIERLHIQRANQRQYFAANQALVEANARDETEAAKLAQQPQTPAKDTTSNKQPSPATSPRRVDDKAKETKQPQLTDPMQLSPTAGALDPLPSLLPNLAPFQGIGGNAPQAVTPPQPMVVPPSITTTPAATTTMQTPPTMPPAPVMPSFQGFAMPPPPPPPDM